ncbi:SCO family protein [Mariniblastus sp.]|nr:SCO family protein [Mariniblastus sp.]MDA7901805.1 SCO family protein [bacterium]MDA7905785.1 SCO family protein [Mariniblastus sp.]MDA7910071.1 SCO family protein [bacterium]MDC0293857.1 SCO family protein [Mariniblastus sp.]
MTFKPNNRIALTLAACFALANWGGFAFGQTSDDQSSKTTTETSKSSDPYGINEKPKVAQGIGVDSQTGESIVRDITFHDEENRFVQIGKYFDGTRPVMLSFNYSDCPKLCSVQLENMTDTLRDIKFKVDEDFQMISLSIDPNEQTSRAKQSKAKYVKRYSKFDRENSQDGWHFLTGDEDDIQLLADICGFRYKYVREQKLYSHPPVFILISPEGKIVRYIHGLNYDAGTIEQALVESAKGKIGSPINILNYGLGCFTFNESTGRYTFQAMAIMRIGGAFTTILLLGTLVPYWLFRRGSKKDDSDYLPTTVG